MMAEDKLEWFGEGFDGFPKRLPEDCVEYSVFILDTTLSSPELRQRLRVIQAASNALTKKLLKEFIWQRDSFDLELVREDGMSILRGRTNYGDSIEDEWLVVYITRELSTQFPEVWIKIVDTDGQFLLIEAANVLPRWLNPEVSDNRVWLNNGQLLIIPLSRSGSKSDKDNVLLRTLTLQDALALILEDRFQLLHIPKLEAEAFYRLRNYPGQINDNLHHASITIPRRLASVLHENAAYVSPAIEAFYLRDPISLYPLYAQSTNALFFPPVDFVTVVAKFTKVGYAQLRSQQFTAPPSWIAIVPSDNNQSFSSQVEMGMKLSCGFEMLLANPHNKEKRSHREIILLLEDINVGKNHLPIDSEIADWKGREDSDAWLDIDFSNFEKELGGRRSRNEARREGGFGDKTVEENLHKMVSRFEDFLNDNNAGNEGAELADDMDSDNDEDEDSESLDSEREDHGLSFDEFQFAETMREVMGLPTQEHVEINTGPRLKDREITEDIDASKAATLGGKTEDEEAEIRQLSQAMEGELCEAGALRLDDLPCEKVPDQKLTRVYDGTSSSQHQGIPDKGSDDDEDLSIDYNLAKNLLESFKSQGGAAGPSSNLLGLMGVRLPRDEDYGHTGEPSRKEGPSR